MCGLHNVLFVLPGQWRSGEALGLAGWSLPCEDATHTVALFSAGAGLNLSLPALPAVYLYTYVKERMLSWLYLLPAFTKFQCLGVFRKTNKQKTHNGTSILLLYIICFFLLLFCFVFCLFF